MTRSRIFKLVLPAAVVLGAGTAVAIAAIPSSSDGVIHACRVTTGATPGQLRVIDVETTPAQACVAGETPRSRNQTGPAAPPGPQGDPGSPGDSGSGTDTGGGSGSGSGAPF